MNKGIWIRRNEEECYYPYELWQDNIKIADLSYENIAQLGNEIDEIRMETNEFNPIDPIALVDALMESGRKALIVDCSSDKACEATMIDGVTF